MKKMIAAHIVDQRTVSAMKHSFFLSNTHCSFIRILLHQAGEPVEKMIAALSVDQRTVLGFPAPGHRYWSERTVQAVGARFAFYGMDMTAYTAASATT
jgi:hypothetical protein